MSIFTNYLLYAALGIICVLLAEFVYHNTSTEWPMLGLCVICIIFEIYFARKSVNDSGLREY